MKKYLGLLLFLVSFTSFGQFSNYTNINGRYKWIAGKFDSTFTIPSGTTPSLRVGGGTGPGALFYSTTDSTVYQYTGTRWTRLRGTDTAHVVSAYVRNTTASTMTAGQVVYINGSTGTTPTIALAVNTADSTSAMTFGFVRGTIAPNAFGWITTFGPLEGVNTNAYTEGEVIYLDSIPGQFTHFKPQAPYHMVTLGYIVKKSGGNGTIFAKVQNGYELEELHNVRITSPVRNNGILAYDSVAQLWKDTTLSAIGGVTGSGTSGQVAYWTGTSSQSGSNNLFWDASNNRLGIGKTTPRSQIDVYQSVDNSTVGIHNYNGGIRISNETTVGGAYSALKFASRYNTSEGLEDGTYIQSIVNGNNNNILAFGQYYDGSTTVEGFRLVQSKLLIGSTVDGGQRLQVNGDALFKGSGNTSGTTALTVQNSDGSNLLSIRNDNLITYSTGLTLSQVGSRITFSSGGGANVNQFRFTTTSALSSPTGNASLIDYVASFSPTSGTGTFVALQYTGTINQTGGANGITRGLYVNPTLTAAADWRSIEWSNNSGWGLYGAGTAPNWLFGSLAIGSGATPLTGRGLYVSQNQNASSGSAWVISAESILQSDVSNANYFTTFARTQNATFTLTNLRHYQASQGTFGASSTVTNQYGFIVNSNLTGATNNFGFYGDIASGTGRWNLYMNGTADNYLAGNLGIGVTTFSGANLRVAKTITGTGGVFGYGILQNGVVQSNVTSFSMGVYNALSTQAASFTLNDYYHYYAQQGTIGASSAVTNQYGYAVDATFTGATNNYGFFGNIASAANRWNIFMNGTAANYMNGNLLLGSTTDGGQKLQVTGAGIISTSLMVGSNALSASVKLETDGVFRAWTRVEVGQFGALQMNTTAISKTATGSDLFEITNAGTMNATAGAYYTFRVRNTFAPTSGTASLSNIISQPTINQTGGANGITRGLYINPTLTAAADWRSLEWSNNTGFGLYGAGSATNYLGGTLGIGTTSPNASAILELSSTTKGFLPPRMTGTEAEAIASPAAGLLVFITNGNGTTITSVGWWGYDSSGWVKLN